MATNNAVNVGLAGSTGTGNFVGANTPTLITPVLGAATGTSLSFSPTTGGIIGTTTNDNAGAGKVGEYIESQTTVASGNISLTNNTNADVTSISLTAGDWDVWGNIQLDAAGGSTTTNVISWLNQNASATLPTFPNKGGMNVFNIPVGTAGNLNVTAGKMRVSLSGTTTVYLSVRSTFSVASPNVYGFIGARRIR